MEQNDNSDNNSDIEFDEEIIIEDVINDIDIDDINTININNELMQNNIENENRNLINNNNSNSNIEFLMSENSNNENPNNNTENESNNSQNQDLNIDDLNNILFNTSNNMMNILRDVLDDDVQDREIPENNLDSFSNLLNNIQSTLINASDRLPSLINELNSNLSQSPPDDEKSSDVPNTNINSYQSNSGLEGDYLNMIRRGNLRTEIRNETSVNIGPNTASDDLDIDNLEEPEQSNRPSSSHLNADYLYALRLQEQEYRMALPNANSLIRQRSTSILRPPRVRTSTQEQQTENPNPNPNPSPNPNPNSRIRSHLEHVNGSLRVRRRAFGDLPSDDIFGVLGQNLFGSIGMPQTHSRNIRTFRDVISSLVNPNEQSYDNIPVVLEEKEINNLKQIEFNDNCIEEGVHQKCTICLGEYEKGEKLTILPCEHGFHTDCINSWLKEYSYKCPICRNETGSGRPVFNNSTRNRSLIRNRGPENSSYTTSPWGAYINHNIRRSASATRPSSQTIASNLGVISQASQAVQAVPAAADISSSSAPVSDANLSNIMDTSNSIEEPVASNAVEYDGDSQMEEVD